MKKATLVGVCWAMAVSGCTLQSSDGAPEEANVSEIGQALEDGTYRVAAGSYDVPDWTQTDPDGSVVIGFLAFYVPEVATQLRIQTFGGSGNLDMKLQFAGKGAGPGTVQCVSANAGTEELCEIAAPPAGYWSSGFQLWDPTEGVRLVQSYRLPVAYEVERFLGELETDAWQAFGPFPVAPGSQLSVQVQDEQGNPDIYVRWDADPDLDHWDCRPLRGRYFRETCEMPVPDGATMAHVSLHGNSRPQDYRIRYRLTVTSAEVL